MADITEKATVEVQVNGEQAKNELQSLEKYATSLKNRIAEAYNAGDTKKMKELEKELKKTNAQLRTMRTNAINIDEVMQNLSTSGPKELQKTLKAINKELESGRVKRGSQEWNEYQSKLKLVNAEIRKIKAEGIEAEGFLSRMNGKLSKWGGMIASVAAALTGVTLAFSKMRKDSQNKEASQDSLKALTGLDDTSVQWLTEEAETLSTTMTKEGLRVQQSSEEILNAFMLVGSAKPELLGVKEELKGVSEWAMTLQAAAQDINLEQSVDALTLSMNQYGAAADKASQYTNVLAAGSKAGSANIESQASSIRNCGTAASSANVSIEQTVGLIETLAYKGIKDEVAGTGLRKFFLVLQTGVDETNPKIVGMEKALDNLQKKNMSAGAIKNMFGEEGFNVASTILQNTKMVRQFTDAVTGTNIAVEQAATNSDNAKARMAQMKNQLKEAGIELMERLNPSVNLLGSYFTNLVKFMPSLIDFIQKYGKTIVYATVVILAYVAVEKLQYFWLTRVKTATGEYIVIQKLKQFWDKAVAASTWLYIAATSALTGKTNQAKLAMEAFFLIIKANPFAFIATLVVAVAGAIYLMTRRMNEAQRAQELLNDVRGEAISQTKSEKQEVESLLKIAKDETLSKGERLKAIKRLNKISPEYLGNLSLEKINTDEAKKSVDKYIQSILLLAEVESAKRRLTDTDTELDELKKKQNKYLKERETFVGAVKALPKNLKSLFTFGIAENTGESFTNSINELEKQRDQLSKIIEDKTLDSIKNEVLNDNNRGNRSFEQVENELKSAKTRLSELLGMSEFEKKKLDYDYAQVVEDVRIKVKSLQEEKEKLTVDTRSTGEKPLDDTAIKKAVQELDAKFAQEKTMQTTLYAIGKIDKQEYDAFVEDSEIKLLDNKMQLYSKDSKEYNDLLQHKLQMQIKQSTQCRQEDIQSLEKQVQEEKRLLLESYLDQSIDKEAFDQGVFDLDVKALKAKRDMYAKETKEFDDYQKRLDELTNQHRLKRQQDYEEIVKQYRKEYQKRTADELMEEEIRALDYFHTSVIMKEEDYQETVKAIKEKYAIQKGENEIGYSYNDQKYAEKTQDIVYKAKAKTENIGNPETDSLWDTMFGNDAKLHAGVIDNLKSTEEEGLISHKQYLIAKGQADNEYYSQLESKASTVYAQIGALMSSYSSYVSACQDVETAKIEKKYEKEITAAGNNSTKVAKLEDAKEKEIAKVKTKYNKKKTTIQIAQALAETAIGALKAYNSAWELGPILGPILGPVFAGMALVSGMLQVATIKKQAQAQEAGYYQGGFTGNGAWNEQKGTVHAGEFVANRYAVRNKEILPVLRLIDNAQKNNTIGSLTATDVSRALRHDNTVVHSSGDNASTQSGEAVTELAYVVARSSEVIDRLTNRLNDPFHTVNTVDGPDGMKQAFDKYNSIQKNKSRHD